MAGRLFMLLLDYEIAEDDKHVVKDLKVELLGEVVPAVKYLRGPQVTVVADCVSLIVIIVAF